MCYPGWECKGKGKWECNECKRGPCEAPPEAVKMLEGPKVNELVLHGKERVLIGIRVGSEDVSTISAKVAKAKVDRICDVCHKIMKNGDKYLRLYGAADDGDPPYVLVQHLACLVTCKADNKIMEALKKAGINVKLTECGHIETISE